MYYLRVACDRGPGRLAGAHAYGLAIGHGLVANGVRATYTPGSQVGTGRGVKKKNRSDITPDPGGHRPQRLCAQGRTCAKQDQVQASAPGQNRTQFVGSTTVMVLISLLQFQKLRILNGSLSLITSLISGMCQGVSISCIAWEVDKAGMILYFCLVVASIFREFWRNRSQDPPKDAFPLPLTRLADLLEGKQA